MVALMCCCVLLWNKYGNMHHEVATSLNNLAMLLQAQERYDEARPLHEESLQIRREVLGNSHPDVATNLNNLALLLEAQVSVFYVLSAI